MDYVFSKGPNSRRDLGSGSHREASPEPGPHRGCGFRWFIEFFFISLSHELKFHHESQTVDLGKFSATFD
jgi:hypothetical protein